MLPTSMVHVVGGMAVFSDHWTTGQRVNEALIKYPPSAHHSLRGGQAGDTPPPGRQTATNCYRLHWGWQGMGVQVGGVGKGVVVVLIGNYVEVLDGGGIGVIVQTLAIDPPCGWQLEYTVFRTSWQIS